MMQRSQTEEVTAQLQRRLAQEAGERDAAKLCLQRLKCAVDASRQRLQSLLVPPALGVSSGVEQGITQRGRDLVRELETQVRSVCQDSLRGLQATSGPLPASPTKGANYEVLRSSLEQEQRRCESLNNDMVSQAEGNDELVDTLGTVKDANKRLLEQIRGQTNEISLLTEQRIDSEAHMDQMTRKHEVEREAMRHETQRQVIATRDAGAERHKQAYTLLTDKIRDVKQRGMNTQQDTKRLQDDLQACRSDAVSIIDFTQSQLAHAERDFTNQCSLLLALHEQRKAAEEDAISDLQLKLSAGREAWQAENLSWNHKYAALTTDRESIEAHASRSVAQLSSRLQACERLALTERNSAAEERAGLERQADEYPQQQWQRQSHLDQLQRDAVVLDSALSAANSEIAGLEQFTIELRRQSRETYDALAAAVSSNEHLRVQMEEQRNSFQDKNEAELDDCRASYELKLVEMRQAAEAHAVMTSRQIEAMEHDVQGQDEELERLKSQIETTAADFTSVERMCSMTRSQFDAATTSREATERKLQEEKHTFQHERVKLQASSEQNSVQVVALEEELRQMSGELHDYRRTASARETEHTTRQAAAEGLLKDLQEMLTDSQSRVREVLDQQARVIKEDTTQREQSLEFQVMLERNLENQKRLREEEGRRLSGLFQTEKRSSEQAQSDFDRHRDSATETLRRAQDEGRSKLAGVERERRQTEETCRIDIAQASQAVVQMERRREAAERDISRLNALLAESESNLAWVLQECGHEDREASLGTRQIEDEVCTMTGTLDLARRDEAALTQQIASQRQRNEEERRRMQRTLDSTGNLKATSVARVPLTVR